MKVSKKDDGIELYRIDQYGSIYEFDEERKAYIFIGKKLQNETDEQAIDRVANEGEQHVSF